MIESHTWAGVTLIGETQEEDKLLATLFDFLPKEAKSENSGWSLCELDSGRVQLGLIND